ncbi:MAG: electron transfer flavoprotein subunit alpha/FixB family protein [Deltaproteobacteria bacterium]|nr:MAG: electron transfer flavoprotein subunit alpha/FixB family protein [Deltaproteobacteria bacterium]
MATIGVWIESDNGNVKKTNYGVITAARNAGENDVVALVIGSGLSSGKAALGEYGVQKIVYITSESDDLATHPDQQAQALAQAIEKLSLDGLLGVASTRGRDLFARLAAILDLPLVSDAVGIDFSGKTVRKSHFSGKTFATIALDSDIMLCTIRPNAIEAAVSATDPAEESLSVSLASPGLVTVIEEKKGDTDKIDLTEADVIITGGRPIGSAENYEMLEECAQLMGAAVGASRAAVDAGFASHGMQVGQTGKTVSPRLYIGCGLSGSVQHFAGMKTSKVIVAVNTDKDAPIFQKCDYGIIADMFDVVPILTEVLKEQRDA